MWEPNWERTSYCIIFWAVTVLAIGIQIVWGLNRIARALEKK